MATPYARAAGKPFCHHGTRCYRAAPDHWVAYDHPKDHWRLSARGDIPSPRVPLIQHPGPVCIEISSTDDEEENADTVSAQAGLFDRGGLIHFQVASVGPQELRGSRRQIADGMDPQLLMATIGVRQDGAATAAAAAVAVAAPPPVAAAHPGVSVSQVSGIATPFGEAVSTIFEVMKKHGQSLGYNKPAEPLVLLRNYDALMRLRRLQGVSRDSNVVVVVCGEGMNAAGNHILDPKCPSGKAVQAAMQRALLGSEYGVSDIITTDVCLGFHPGTGSQPTDENIEHGFLLNSMFIDMLVKYDFAVVVVCIGLAASKKLYPALKSRRDIIVTCTYHAVLVSNDMRNGFTTNAARVSVAAAARLARLVVDYLLASEALPPTLEEARAKALTYPFHLLLSYVRVFSLSQISRALLGDDQSSWWKTAEATKHVREISDHEVSEFVVIRRSNGINQTITPAMRESARAAGEGLAERSRLENAAGNSRACTQVHTLMKCPYSMPSCNRRSTACAQCRAELGLPPRSYNRPPKKSELASRGSS
jgi:hypothetical protein